MNPLSIFFTLASERAKIRRAMELYERIKDPLTELIDIGRELGAQTGLLGPQPNGGADIPASLAKYDAKWVQETLAMVTGMPVPMDGNLSGDATKSATRKFQAANPPLAVDGFAGAQTVMRLVAARDKLEK